MLKPVKDAPKYRKWHVYAFRIFLFGDVLILASLLASLAVGKDNPVVNYLGYAAILCVIVFYAINMMLWRCPNCSRPLPVFGPVLVCNRCKRKFVDEKGNPQW